MSAITAVTHPSSHLRVDYSAWNRNAYQRAESVALLAGYAPRDLVVVSPLVAAGASFDVQINLPASPAYLLGYAATSVDSTGVPSAAGFDVRIHDQTTGRPFSNGAVWSHLLSPVVGNFPGLPAGLKSPIALLPQPSLIPQPGTLRASVRNLANFAARIEIVLFVAAPVLGEPPVSVLGEQRKVLSLAPLDVASIGTGTLGGGRSSVIGGDDSTLKTTPISFTLSGENLILGGMPDRAVRVWGLDLWVDPSGPATDVLIKARQAGADVLVTAAFGTGRVLVGNKKNFSGQISYIVGSRPHWILEPGEALFVETTAAVECAGSVSYEVLE